MTQTVNQSEPAIAALNAPLVNNGSRVILKSVFKLANQSFRYQTFPWAF